MTKEDKELLFKDLHARLQYKVFVKYKTTRNPAIVKTIDNEKLIICREYSSFVHSWECCIDDIKPYLRPMSSMTEKEWETLRLLKGKLIECDENNDEKFYGIINEIHTFYYSYHIDCNGLIDKGLALEAPEDMYKISNE